MNLMETQSLTAAAKKDKPIEVSVENTKSFYVGGNSFIPHPVSSFFSA
jgi:hypothetical protein